MLFPSEIAAFQEMMVLFHILRNGNRISTVHGSYLEREDAIEFLEQEPINLKSGDHIEDAITGQRYLCESVRALDSNTIRATVSVFGHSKAAASGTVYNIGSVSGNSIIGNQNIGSVSFGASLSDIEALIRKLPRDELAEGMELMGELEKLERSDAPVSLRGILKKFEDFLQKHEDLFLMLGKWAVQLMIS